MLPTTMPDFLQGTDEKMSKNELVLTMIFEFVSENEGGNVGMAFQVMGVTAGRKNRESCP